MGKTTFTGPVKAGNIPNTSGTTLGKDVKNVGFVTMAQAVPITQAASTGQSAGVYKTDIVLPANSHIIGIQLAVTTAWTGAASTVSIGTTSGGAELVSLGAGGTIGIIALSPGSDATRTAKWDDVGTTDIRIWVNSTNTGSGIGTIVVRYIQAQDTV
jgi:hypothetical protein